MKKLLKINREFHEKYLTNCIYFKYRQYKDSEYSFDDFKYHMEQLILPLSQFFNSTKYSFAGSADFCEEYDIDLKCVDDIAFIYGVIAQSWVSAIYYESESEGRKEKRKLFDLINRSHEITGITIHQKRSESLKIKSQEVINLMVQLIQEQIRSIEFESGFGSFREYERITNEGDEIFNSILIEKNPRTHDLVIFSWTILQYLNDFTQYKAPNGTLATNQQCRIIYDILNTEKIVDELIDVESYIRVYLKKGQAFFQNDI